MHYQSVGIWNLLVYETVKSAHATTIHEICHDHQDRRTWNFFPGVVIFSENHADIYVLPEFYTLST